MPVLKGMTWDHSRGYDPMVATSKVYAEAHPGVEITWEKRSLQAFADRPIEEMAFDYDLMVIDHPHVGEAARNKLLARFDGQGHDEALAVLAQQSLGVSHPSYEFDGHQWGLAIDAASQVAAFRPDLLDTPPETWAEVIRLAEQGKALWPIKPVDAISSFFTLAANIGQPCAHSGDQPVDRATGRYILEQLQAVARHVPRDCLTMNPILTFEWLSTQDDKVYCPLGYGYTNYARAGYRNHRLRFWNIPALGDDGPKGSNIGGTGIAVSAHSKHLDIALDYAVWIAGAECQKGVFFDAGGQPANREAWIDPRTNAETDNFFTNTIETLERAYLRPRYDGYLKFQEWGGDIVNAFLAGTLEADAALDRLDAAFRKSQE